MSTKRLDYLWQERQFSHMQWRAECGVGGVKGAVAADSKRVYKEVNIYIK